MKIQAISPLGNNNINIINKTSLNKTCENNSNNFEFSNSLRNYIIPFTGRNNLPDKLRVNNINECHPVPDDDNDSERLSGVMSTALKYIREDNPVILGCSNRRDIQNLIGRSFSNENIFRNAKTINYFTLVEDDRIIDKPIMIVLDDKKLYVIGDIQIINKETKEKRYSNTEEKTLINPEVDSLRFYATDLDNISLGEYPDKRDLQYIKQFKVEDVMDLEFRTSGTLIPGEFTATPPKNGKFVSGTYPMFSDIGGNKEAIERVIETIYAPIVYPEIYGHIMTKGAILEGPPGTGKSMLGIALANEIAKRLGQKVHIQEISGAQMQIPAVGGSEAKWRATFETAIDNQPAIILIDEIDACTPTRDDSSNARFDNSVVNQLLSIFSQLEKSDNKVYVIGMTNRVDAIDPAMLRAGRLGNIISMPAPNYDEARDIYNKTSIGYKFDDTVNTDELLKKIVKLKGTGAMIAGTLEKAQIYSRRRNNINQRVLAGTLTKEDYDNCIINREDIEKALKDEEEKQKKAKISSDRIVIKGFKI